MTRPTGRRAGLVLRVGRGGGLDMDVQPAEATGRAATFRIAFLNQAPALVALSARDRADALRVRLAPIKISFTPRLGGPRRATLVIADNAVDTPQIVTLSGDGRRRPSQNQLRLPRHHPSDLRR